MSVETNPQDIVSTWVSLCPTIPPGFHEGLETAPSSEAARAFLCLGCFWGSQLRPTILIQAYTQIISLVYISICFIKQGETMYLLKKVCKH